MDYTQEGLVETTYLRVFPPRARLTEDSNLLLFIQERYTEWFPPVEEPACTISVKRTESTVKKVIVLTF